MAVCRTQSTTRWNLPIAEMRDVLERPGREVVEHADVPARVEKELREMRTDEPGAAGDQGLGHPSGLTRLAGA